MCGKQFRRFNSAWYEQYPWLEYSAHKDAAYCFPCFLFSSERQKNKRFLSEGFENWKKVGGSDCALRNHCGVTNSAHSQSLQKWHNLPIQEHSIQVAFNRQTEHQIEKNRLRLTATIEALQFLTRQGLALRGHDESTESLNRGKFLQLLLFMCKQSEKYADVCFYRAPRNATMTSPDVQKDVVSAFASEVRASITSKIGNRFFCILVDESRDESAKEQMSLVIRFVDERGLICERFLDMVHVSDTRSATLMKSIGSTLNRHGLTFDRVRGQGYDGASNMRGEMNGLKSLILEKNPSAFYVHCFAHRLQLALMSAAKSNVTVSRFFNNVNSVCVVIGASAKRADQFRDAQATHNQEKIYNSNFQTGRGLNQECSLRRCADTRWGSHLVTLIRLMNQYPSVVDVVEQIVNDTSANPDFRGEALRLMETVLSDFEFVFLLHLMRDVLLKKSEALRRKRVCTSRTIIDMFCGSEYNGVVIAR